MLPAVCILARGLLFGADKILISSGRDNKGPYFSGVNINFQLLEETLGKGFSFQDIFIARDKFYAPFFK
jgi:hypothetical protein